MRQFRVCLQACCLCIKKSTLIDQFIPFQRVKTCIIISIMQESLEFQHIERDGRSTMTALLLMGNFFE